MKGRVLAVDWGTKRIGLAISDPMRLIAKPLEVVAATDEDAVFAGIAGRIEAEDVREIVVGVPINDDGSKGPMALKVEGFAERLRARVAIPVHLCDEGWSSVEAEDFLAARGEGWRERRGKVDALAARLVLQAWLDSRREG